MECVKTRQKRIRGIHLCAECETRVEPDWVDVKKTRLSVHRRQPATGGNLRRRSAEDPTKLVYVFCCCRGSNLFRYLIEAAIQSDGSIAVGVQATPELAILVAQHYNSVSTSGDLGFTERSRLAKTFAGLLQSKYDAPAEAKVCLANRMAVSATRSDEKARL
jgi:hypothetical protein